MKSTLSVLVSRLSDRPLSSTCVIPWGAPVPSFGNLSRSRVATLGLNPSNREFVDINGRELDGGMRRFHTLKSLGLVRWSDASKEHLKLIENSCRNYFCRNPYDGWFGSLDRLITGTGASYYRKNSTACHLDIVPFATARKWSELSIQERSRLLDMSGDALGFLLRDSQVRLLILNGRSVVEGLQAISGVDFDKKEVSSWELPRKSGRGVSGYSYEGVISEISGVKLGRDIKVLGFNHNIQSSFGVTSKVRHSIQAWIADCLREGGCERY